MELLHELPVVEAPVLLVYEIGEDNHEVVNPFALDSAFAEDFVEEVEWDELVLLAGQEAEGITDVGQAVRGVLDAEDLHELLEAHPVVVLEGLLADVLEVLL